MTLVFRGIELRRVVKLAGLRVGTLDLQTLEIYDDGVVVRWQQREPEPWRAEEVALRDASETEFVLVGTSAHGGPEHELSVMRGECVFVPTIPPSADHLDIISEGERVSVPLDT